METEAEGTRILFLGLRYADDEWQLTDYPAKAQLEKISAQVRKRKPEKEDKKQPEEKNQPKRGKKVEKDVFKDNESA